MSPWGLVLSQPAKCQPDSQERPTVPIKRLNRGKQREGSETRGQPQTGKHVSVRAVSRCPLVQLGRFKEKRMQEKGPVCTLIMSIPLCIHFVVNHNMSQKSFHRAAMHVIQLRYSTKLIITK